MKRSPVPYIAGFIAAVAAILLIFNPFKRGGGSDNLGSDPQVLLSTGEDRSAPDAPVDEYPREESIPVTGKDSAVKSETVSISEGWKKKFDAPVTSSPAAEGGRVVFGCRDGCIYSFTDDGKFDWKYNSGNGIGASPFCTDGKVVCANYEGDIFCLDSVTGEVVWKYAAGFKIVSSPKVRERLVVTGTMDGRLVALDMNDGRHLWTVKIGEGIWASTTIGENYIIAATTDGDLVRLDHSGKIEWRTRPGGDIYSSPLCLDKDNLIVFGTGDKYLFGYSLSEGNLMWRFGAGSDVRSSPATDGERIFAGSDDGVLYSLSLKGVKLWMVETGGAIRSKPLILGDVIFVTGYNNKCSAYSTLDGKVLGEYSVESPVYSSPASSGNLIFFGSNQGMLHAAEFKKG